LRRELKSFAARTILLPRGFASRANLIKILAECCECGRCAQDYFSSSSTAEKGVRGCSHKAYIDAAAAAAELPTRVINVTLADRGFNFYFLAASAWLNFNTQREESFLPYYSSDSSLMNSSTISSLFTISRERESFFLFSEQLLAIFHSGPESV